MSAAVTLDVRLPIGAMFFVDGIVLSGYGLVTETPPEVAALAGNINLWWGGVLVLFGGTMLGFALRARKKR
ncbi:MAG: hypothetical protein SGI86_19690 [Deltaproteobacteria bacterium]|nr:hypothetical protein [Deltaproteobacteria bacterium]